MDLNHRGFSVNESTARPLQPARAPTQIWTTRTAYNTYDTSSKRFELLFASSLVVEMFLIGYQDCFYGIKKRDYHYQFKNP